MIRTIAYKEFLEIVREGRAKWAAGIILAFLIAALAVGLKHYREVSAQHQMATRAVRTQWASQPEKNPHSGAHYGTYAFKPIRFLSAVDPGINPYVGVAVWVEAHIQNQFEFKPAEDATAIQRFGELSTAMILQVFLPLLIILISFSSFSGEREQGTMRQLISTGVRPSRLAAGKALGLVAALSLVLVPAATIGALALTLLTDPAGARLDLSRIALLALFYLSYFGVFIGISLAVSAKARSSRVALLGLLGFWIFNSLIGPRLASDVARVLYPTPSSFEFDSKLNNEINYGTDGKTTQRLRTEKLRKKVLAQYGVKRGEDLPVNFYGLRLEDNEQWGYKIFDKYFGELYQIYEKQNRFRELSALVAPLMAIRPLSMGLSGTDIAHHWDFVAAAEQYRRLEIKMINDDITYNGAGIEDYRNGRELWAKIPDFQYHRRSAAWALSNHPWSLVILALWLGLAIALPYRAAGNITP